MLTIGRLGTLSGVEPKTLRYYDRVGLVRPAGRTWAGYRMYGEDAVDRLRFIRRAKALGMSLADIRRILAVRDEGAAPCQHVLALVSDNLKKVEGQIAQLTRLGGGSAPSADAAQGSHLSRGPIRGTLSVLRAHPELPEAEPSVNAAPREDGRRFRR
jgi:DNA-binding transcriptional MerR regulator